MGDKCEICKKNTAKIRIGNHSYCFDCHNKMALLDMGVEDTFEYAKTMSVIEPGVERHFLGLPCDKLLSDVKVAQMTLLKLGDRATA